jgi:hypothetical protein
MPGDRRFNSSTTARPGCVESVVLPHARSCRSSERQEHCLAYPQAKGLPYDADSFVEAWQTAVSPKSTDKVMAEVAS